MVIIKLFLATLVSCDLASASIKVAITIDDLPAHGPLPMKSSRLELISKILSTLKEEKIPEVYGFINAVEVERDPVLIEGLKLWRSFGYPFGNHTYSHPSLPKSSIEEYENEIEKNEPLLAKLGEGTDWHYFRYPFLFEGNTLEKRNAVRSFLFNKNYKIAQVTIDFEDWSWNGPYARCFDKNNKKAIAWLKKTYLQNAVDQLEREEIISHGLFNRPIAHILLLHVGAFDSEMLKVLIQAYKKKGVEFIGLSEAIKDDIYTIDPKFVSERGGELTFRVMKSRNLKLSDFGLAKYTGYPEKALKGICR